MNVALCILAPLSATAKLKDESQDQNIVYINCDLTETESEPGGSWPLVINKQNNKIKIHGRTFPLKVTDTLLEWETGSAQDSFSLSCSLNRFDLTLNCTQRFLLEDGKPMFTAMPGKCSIVTEKKV